MHEFNVFKSFHALKLIILIKSEIKTIKQMRIALGNVTQPTISEKIYMLEKHKLILGKKNKQDTRKKDYVFLGEGNAFSEWIDFEIKESGKLNNLPTKTVNKIVKDFLKSSEGKMLFEYVTTGMMYNENAIEYYETKNLDEVFRAVCQTIQKTKDFISLNKNISLDEKMSFEKMAGLCDCLIDNYPVSSLYASMKKSELSFY